FKGVKMDYKMKLTEDELAILNGEKGEVMAKVMKSLVCQFLTYISGCFSRDDYCKLVGKYPKMITRKMLFS
ncbi:MAG: hypothetical protein PHT13_14955, partial [Methanosarcina sp.]|nr:hypothetical protein [Methanosarcina sp.]